jgi:hypothetical protein
MKRWTHPQDFLVLAVGAYALLSPLWTPMTGRAAATLVVLGALTLALGWAELMRPDMLSMEGLTALVGAAFFVSPWLMGFADERMSAWTAWIVGGITFAIGLADVQVTRAHHRRGMATTH